MAGRVSLQNAQISCGDISAPGGRQMYVVYYSDVKLETLPDSGGVCTQIIAVVNLTFGNLGFTLKICRELRLGKTYRLLAPRIEAREIV
jgi:hypothetical protein